MLHRISKKNDINKDKWIGIGGHFLVNESPEDCLLREAKEETGLTLTSYRYRGIVTFITDGLEEAEYMHLYTADGFEGELINCDEGTLEWVPKEEIYNLNQTLFELELGNFTNSYSSLINGNVFTTTKNDLIDTQDSKEIDNYTFDVIISGTQVMPEN